jgi:HAD superfamily hydrolase (TIGR01509 family)
LTLAAAIFDVDGVLLASPHERAWREALPGFADPGRFTTAMYQAHVAGQPRLSGARAALEQLGVPDAKHQAVVYAQRKQQRLEELIAAGSFAAFPDAIRFVEAVDSLGIRMAVASSSKNADQMMELIRVGSGRSLLEVFSANVCGRDLRQGKPSPEIFLLAAAELGMTPARCFVIEDAPVGIRAARVGGMTALGVARHMMEPCCRQRVPTWSCAASMKLRSENWRMGACVVVKSDENKNIEDALKPTSDPAWMLHEHGYNPLRERGIESRLSIGNGFLGVRGAPAICGEDVCVSGPRIYVAGLFDTPDILPRIPALVSAPEWVGFTILINGEPLIRRPDDMVSLQRTLDMRRGALLSTWHRVAVVGEVVRVRSLCLVSLVDRGIGLQIVCVETGDEAEITLEGSCVASDPALEQILLASDLGVWRVGKSGKSLAVATAVALKIDGREVTPVAADKLKWRWRWKSQLGQIAYFERMVAFVRSDHPGDDPGPAGQETLAKARRLGSREIIQRHEAVWDERWRCGGFEVGGDEAAQRALRFATYHLSSAANPADESVSVGARAMTGDDYRGHVFWDTEIYLLPFYTLTWPEAARALLMYRYHSLAGARAKAARMGLRGAFYAWESTSGGEETTPDQVIGTDGTVVQILSGKEEEHISADVAYAVWNYWRATGDDEFLLAAGAEILFETARFWASRAQLEADGRRHIRDVEGPDEYHGHIDDNAFTNMMARWNLRRAIEVATQVRERWPERGAAIASRIALDEAECKEWNQAADTLATGLDVRTGLTEQFAGYFDLEEIDLAQYSGRSTPMDVVLGRERAQSSQVIKQADVVALLALLPEEFDRRSRVLNFRYYEPRCDHGSSLSQATHALVAARLGDTELALSYFRNAASIDLAEDAAGSSGGVHIATMGGLWQVAVFGFAGLSFLDDALALDPQLPAQWSSFGFRVQWRGRRLRVQIEREINLLSAMLEEGEPLKLIVADKTHELLCGLRLRVAIQAVKSNVGA